MTIPLALKPEDWPAPDLELWIKACQPPDFLEGRRPASEWSTRRRRIVEQAYGQWLSFLVRHAMLEADTVPGARVNRDRMLTFIHELQGRVSSASVGLMIGALLRMMNALEPAMDWAWLSSLAQYLKVNARSERSRLAHMVPPRELYDLGLALMRKGRELGEDVYHAATIARDGLMIAMLICCPLRIKNFKELSIGQQLLYDSERHQYWIKLSEEETKTGREYVGEYPIELSEWIEWYLTGPRKQLLSQGPGEATRHMWINRFGRPMGENAVRYQIELRTRDAFGSHVWPHLFRAISATGLVDEAPDKIAIAQDLLGHNDVYTTQKHYILARGNKAHKQVHDALERARAETLSQLREHLGTIRRRRKGKAH